MTRSSFELSKWYFDCVTPEGRAFIGYAATLRWKSLALHYQSSLLHSDHDGTRVGYSLRKMRAPGVFSPVLHWQSPSLQFEGTWNALEPPARGTIFQSERGTIEWQCVQPRASASVCVPHGDILSGLGYAEHLRMTVAPWRLPIKELRWGRFLSAAHSLVWIDWQGSYSTRIVYFDGAPAKAERITEQQVVLTEPKVVLDFEGSSVLRQGTLAETALSRIPNVRKLFPRSVLGIRECKWKSRAVLSGSGLANANGWAIHEVVQWP